MLSTFGAVTDGVDDAEGGLRVLRRDLLDGVGVGEADGDDRVVARAGQLGRGAAPWSASVSPSVRLCSWRP